MKIGSLPIAIFLASILLISGCQKKDDDGDNGPGAPGQTDPYHPQIMDDYSSISDIAYSDQWGPYNLHDPTIIKHDSTYYIFSTDVAYGPNLRCGIMHRKSTDLVQWDFLGWVFDGVPDIPLQFMEQYQPGYEQLSIWAPYITYSHNEYRLYYSVPGNDWLKLACIGLATAPHPEGPWTDDGIVLYCHPEDHYNAIDPAVIVDQANGNQWMTYGSYSSGIYIVELNPETGKLKVDGDRGTRIAYRKFDHDAIEGAETIYNEELDKYFMFVSYDWLEDNYNVRVGRSDSPTGPFLDFNGNDLAATGENTPMIIAQYKFNLHSGWQGLGHCGLLKDGDDYFFVSQGRLASNKFLMNLHVRKMVFSDDGWPLISPERYAAIPQDPISDFDLVGTWEHVRIEQTAWKNIPQTITLNEDGSIEEYPDGSWSRIAESLTLSFGNDYTLESKIFREWDWERNTRTIVYTGITATGKCGWGKKIEN